MNNLIKKILIEWSYRLDDGMIDLENNTHLSILREVLSDMKLPSEVIIEVMSNITEKEKEWFYAIKKDTKKTSRFGSKETRDTAIKTGTHTPVDKKDDETEPSVNIFDEPKVDTEASKTKIKLTPKILDVLSDEDRKTAEEFQKDYDDFKANPTKEKALKLVEKYDLKRNQNGKKIYPGTISASHRHIFNGSGAGLQGNTKVIGALEKYLGQQLPLATKGDKLNPSTPMGEATKPKSHQFGSPVKASDDPNVDKIYEPDNNPAFDDFEEKYKGVYGPTDKDGNLLYPSSKYPYEYMNQNIDSLDEAIEKAKELEKPPMKLNPKVRKAMEEYKSEQKRIMEKYKGKLPSKEAAKELKKAYANYSQKLISVDPKLAKSMLKNQAEVFIYNYELARGDEVYLPSHPSFPGADKLIRTSDGTTEGEQVSGISVKVGADGSVKVMGFPTETKQMLRFHKSREYRNNTTSQPGKKGYAVGLKDEVVDNDESMDKLMSESGMDKVITDKKEYYRLLREYKEFMIKFNEENDYNGKGLLTKEAKEKLVAKKKELLEKINKLVDKDKLTELVGEKNSKSLLKTSPTKLLQGMNYMAACNTDGGIQGLRSHSQKITDDGIDMATKDFPNDFKKLDFTTFREHEDSRNGGLTVGVTHPDEGKGEII